MQIQHFTQLTQTIGCAAVYDVQYAACASIPICQNDESPGLQ